MGLDFTIPPEFDWLAESRDEGEVKSQISDRVKEDELREEAHEKLINSMVRYLLEVDDSTSSRYDAKMAAENIIEILPDDRIEKEAENAWEKATNYVSTSEDFLNVFYRRWGRALVDQYDRHRHGTDVRVNNTESQTNKGNS